MMGKTPALTSTNAQTEQGEKSAFSDQIFGLEQRLVVDNCGHPKRFVEKPRRPRHLWPLFLLLALIIVTKGFFFYSYISTCSDCSADTAPPHHRMSPLPPTTSTNPRETVIDMQSGSVTGSYSLYDLLSIHTTSGHIDITVSLHNASSEDPKKPASLHLSTASGSIRVRTSHLSSYSSSSSSSQIPDRQYETEISSRSGSLDAILVHGTHTSLKTNSGSITAALSPHGPNSTRSEVLTSSNSGHTDVTVYPLLGDASAPVRQLYADYRHGSGGLVLSYPSMWEGTVQGTTASGGINVKWDGMRVVKDRKGLIGREFEAVKGQGEGVLKFKGYSGHVELSGKSDYWALQQEESRESTVIAEEPPPYEL
ncbi:MAG: hypothetical protein Q9191_002196 [Dirinaria sp. TL-2023a]